jgi:phosphoglycerate kinase
MAVLKENVVNKKTIRDLDVRDQKVLVRVDFNVPLEDGGVSDDTRILAALPTIQYLLDEGAALILCSHLGRPKGQVVEKLKMDPVAACLSELLSQPVLKLDDCVGAEVEGAVKAAKPGDVILLDNTRYHPG